MQHYHHVLFCTDLSSESEQIGARAKQIAENHTAKLSIVHVIEHTPMIYGSGEFAVPVDLELEETLETKAKESIAKQAASLQISTENQFVLLGSKKEEISHLAEERNCDLIVIGAHDKHGLALLFSSTTDSIIHALPCDVLAVRVDS